MMFNLSSNLISFRSSLNKEVNLVSVPSETLAKKVCGYGSQTLQTIFSPFSCLHSYFFPVALPKPVPDSKLYQAWQKKFQCIVTYPKVIAIVANIIGFIALGIYAYQPVANPPEKSTIFPTLLGIGIGLGAVVFWNKTRPISKKVQIQKLLIKRLELMKEVYTSQLKIMPDENKYEVARLAYKEVLDKVENMLTDPQYLSNVDYWDRDYIVLQLKETTAMLLLPMDPDLRLNKNLIEILRCQTQAG